jgi:hypothetical protein
MLSALFERCAIGEPVSHGSVTILPLIATEDWGPPYLSMAEALDTGHFFVSEVSASGSVPELKVDNGGDTPVLLLDGEELKGAKQNRVINTTVLVAARTTVVIPVSCTEQGRWRSQGAHFSESPHCLLRTARASKAKSVSDNLRYARSHASDQGRVWEDIRAFAREADVESPTGAMSDVFSRREKDLESYLAAFSRCEGQRGLLVFIKGLPAGLDIVSSERAFSRLHPKLIRSYCIEDALSPSKQRADAWRADAQAFLHRAASCPGVSFPSPGLGTDHRFEADGLVGSALEVEGTAIHAAFFMRADRPKGLEDAPLGDFRSRREHRSRPGNESED